MKFFKKTVEPTLDDLHAEAEVIGANAVGLFHAITADLRRAEERYLDVAEKAWTEAQRLLDLYGTASDNAQGVRRQAEAVGSLLGQ